MTDPIDPEDMELMRTGKPVRNLAEILQTGLFQGATVDLFYEGQHLRIEKITFVVRGNDISVDTRFEHSPILQLRKGAWKIARRQSLDFYVTARATPVAFHDGNGKLMFTTVAHVTPEGQPAQFVLYRAGRTPSADDLQIINWPPGLQPELGGRPMKRSLH